MKSDIPCFKEGGSVYKSRMHKEDPQELAEDKAMVKKGIRQHEAAQHKGEPKTEIKLKAGRRVKKTGGVVNKFKTGGVVGADGKGNKQDPIKKVKDTSGKANAPSATMGKKKDPTTNFKKGRWVNEEPDDATAVPTKPRKVVVPKKAPTTMDVIKGQSTPSEYERQQIMEMFQGGPEGIPQQTTPAMKKGGKIKKMAYGGAATTGLDRAAAMSGRTMPTIGGGAPGMVGLDRAAAMSGRTMPTAGRESLPDMIPQAGAAGLGTALNTGALGAAGPMGASRNVPMTPQEQDVIRGLQAVGSYCRGGKV